MAKKCIIVGAMNFDAPILAHTASDLVIAADAGYRTLLDRQEKPDMIIGDFDSLGEIPKMENVTVFPVMKDDTDMMLCIKKGIEEGCDVFYLYGGIGGRLDHTLANIQSLGYLAEQGKRGYLIGEDFTITVLKNEAIRLRGKPDEIVSVFSLGTMAKGVTIQNLLYETENETLTCAFPLGVSNHFTGKDALIEVKDGMVVVLWYGTTEDIRE